MGNEFHEVCEQIDPDSEALYRKVALECVAGRSPPPKSWRRP
jgi:hypothetical protein